MKKERRRRPDREKKGNEGGGGRKRERYVEREVQTITFVQNKIYVLGVKLKHFYIIF